MVVNLLHTSTSSIFRHFLFIFFFSLRINMALSLLSSWWPSDYESHCYGGTDTVKLKKSPSNPPPLFYLLFLASLTLLLLPSRKSIQRWTRIFFFCCSVFDPLCLPVFYFSLQSWCSTLKYHLLFDCKRKKIKRERETRSSSVHWTGGEQWMCCTHPSGQVLAHVCFPPLSSFFRVYVHLCFSRHRTRFSVVLCCWWDEEAEWRRCEDRKASTLAFLVVCFFFA